MQAWIVWLIIAGALGTAELLTATLDLLLLACAALVAAGVAAVGLGLGFQLLAFAAAATVMLAVVRPIARRHLTSAPVVQSGTAALVGREAEVLVEVSKNSGLVRIGGEEWTARAYDPHRTIPVGATVDVFAIEGATALVHPQEDPWPS
ncbi:NfeD family protein [Phytoactinopolyspora halotolerans]|uniref:NfeD family protein n=1 Tax=Phytoactinopolyspora halotolerans TaxID=1981512 RepID=A0A6L9SGZ9_9ACTN|nr:NfeD family protein [Phytoactinopolyspora halotolerans]NEE03360.1 NfeD family protein [Phytoactinopolyspora halotolerans]